MTDKARVRIEEGAKQDGQGAPQLYDSGLLYDDGHLYDDWGDTVVQGEKAKITIKE